MSEYFSPDEMTRVFREAVAQARSEALRAGVPIFYRDPETSVDVMEQSDGRKFEIRFVAGAPAGQSFEIVRELSKTAA